VSWRGGRGFERRAGVGEGGPEIGYQNVRKEGHEVMEHVLKYRPEVDGLRAIAVGAVLLFHAKLGMPGGYVGVDVFFVISGYLITSLILKDCRSSEGFSIVRFWERRVRRIFPALLVVIVATLVAGWFLLLPSHFESLGASVLAQAAFAGNIYFWATSGYFGNEASTIPLLHTWSLAVEEQYYLLFPLLFLLPVVWTSGRLRWLLGFLFAGSLALSVWQVARAPDAAFFLLPSRAWELMAGALLAVVPARPQTPRWLLGVTGWGGLAAVLAAMLLYTEETPFPGWAALAPVLGTAAIIWSTGQNERPSVLCRMLSWRPVVFVGLISYSLYLWHWPVLVYATYWPDNHILWWPWRAGLLVLSFVLAVLSWRYVETPFRRRQWCAEQRRLFAFGAALPVACMVGGGVVLATHGFPARYADEIVRIDRGISSSGLEAQYPSARATTLAEARSGQFDEEGDLASPVACLLWGDSQAMSMAPVLRRFARENASRVQIAAHPATVPVIGYRSFDKDSLRDDSPAWVQAVLDHVRRERIPLVVLAASWGWYAARGADGAGESDGAMAEFGTQLAETTRVLREAGADVWILKRIPVQSGHFRISLAKEVMAGREGEVGVSRAEHERYSREENQMLALAVAAGARVLDPAPYFFADGDRCLLREGDEVLFWDAGHVSTLGALRLSPLFRKALQP
jgi:peptidoglycan/LPS O-acetylase OafA/YrhL